MIWAIIHRWWYLLTVGIWRDERSITIYHQNRIRVIGTGVPTKVRGCFVRWKIFWERKL